MRLENRDASTEVRLARIPYIEGDLLLREMTHRVNNEFASVIGLLNVASARSQYHEVRAALADVADHLHNFARLHRALQMPTGDGRIDIAEYVRTLCGAISHSLLMHKDIELTFVEHSFYLDAMQCWCLGMILSELITNSCKHAFRDRGGRIRIEILKRGYFVECTVADNGSTQAVSRRNQGLNIISSLVSALNGAIDQRFGSRGAISVITFPFD